VLSLCLQRRGAKAAWAPEFLDMSNCVVYFEQARIFASGPSVFAPCLPNPAHPTLPTASVPCPRARDPRSASKGSARLL